MPAQRFRFFATCAKGTEGPLRRELAALRLPGVRGERGGVAFEGKLEAGLEACLYSRVAMRILLEVAQFDAAGGDALYEGAKAVDWSPWLTPKTTLAVEATVRDSELTHSHYAALKVKDAVVDALREKHGARPSVDAKDPDVAISLHLVKDRATLSLDLGGEPLHRRGYRAAMHPAPLKETLAAAMLALGGADPELPFVDPMCGSGTLAIEHALVTHEIAPGLRRAFGFQRWPCYRGQVQSLWDQMKADAGGAILARAPAPILCRDVSEEALEAARRNAAAARVAADMTFELGDARKLERRWPKGTLCFNPPYGERLKGKGHLQVSGFYRGISEVIAGLAGWRVIVLSGNPLLEAELRKQKLTPAVRHRLWNGPLEVSLLRYDI
jgi:putative N6-adenine-specific DNA methylase